MPRLQRATDRSPRRRRQKGEDALTGLNLDFSQSPTTWNFLNDDSFVRGLMGPVGSGKTYASLAEVMLRAVKQPPSPVDNIRYTRFAVIGVRCVGPRRSRITSSCLSVMARRGWTAKLFFLRWISRVTCGSCCLWS